MLKAGHRVQEPKAAINNPKALNMVPIKNAPMIGPIAIPESPMPNMIPNIW
jgi:hypothetical protein